jgi:hypothetical protein
MNLSCYANYILIWAVSTAVVRLLYTQDVGSSILSSPTMFIECACPRPHTWGMRYPFLEHNQLVVIDYLPGSSGQLLMRLWSECDARLDYDNSKIFADHTITDHPASLEIDHDVVIPKSTVEWFLSQCEPQHTAHYLQFWEQLATTLMAVRQRWIRGTHSVKFYADKHYELVNQRLIYGMHSKRHAIPWPDLCAAVPGLRPIKLVPQTAQGLVYQQARYQACYPKPPQDMLSRTDTIRSFNATAQGMEIYDFCSALVNRDTHSIVQWLTQQLGPDLREHKLSRVAHILEQYYREIVDRLDV